MRLFALLFLLTASVVTVPTAPAALTVASVAPGDTFRLVAAWPAVSDAQGPATSYTVTWKHLRYGGIVLGTETTLPPRVVTGLADTVLIPAPPYSDSLRVTVQVSATRNGYTSATSATAVRFFRRANPVPPAPATVTLDTAST